MSMVMMICGGCGEAVWPLNGYRDQRYCESCKSVQYHWCVPLREIRELRQAA